MANLFKLTGRDNRLLKVWNNTSSRIIDVSETLLHSIFTLRPSCSYNNMFL